MRSFSKFCVVVVFGVAATGCVVLPYGHGRNGRGGHHHLQDNDGRWSSEAPRQDPRSAPR
jgi:hypothetical protein